MSEEEPRESRRVSKHFKWKRRRWTKRRVRLFLRKLPYCVLRLRAIERLWLFGYTLAATSFALWAFGIFEGIAGSKPAH